MDFKRIKDEKILEENGMLYITNGVIVWLLHLKTGAATETTNPKIIRKVLDTGEQMVPLDSDSEFSRKNDLNAK